jgi:hypothetical protein
MTKIYFLFALLGIFISVGSMAQVTTSSITGMVKTADDKALEGATITAIHVPSGTKYVAIAGKGGNYTMASVRVGGPYKVTASFTGFQTKTEEQVFANLGSAANVDFDMALQTGSLGEVTVTAMTGGIISSKKTGASATLGRETINRVPTIGRTLNDVTKFNAYSNGRSFAGQDSRLNNFTIDGSVFNNGFGLGSQAQAGGRTGSSAISLDALEEVQINIAPYDIRQSGFVGAAINAVTRSGTNEYSGSVYRFWNNRDLAGDKAAGNAVPNTPFNVETNGFRVGGPIIKNKLFFFANGEFVNSTRPALDWVANRPGAVGNASRTTAADLEDLSKFMKEKLNYDMGLLDNFNNESFSNKFIGRVDWNINDKHKLTLRYSHHDSESDIIVSNSNSGNTAGNGNRQNLALAISAQNNGYKIQDNTRSFVAELNSTFKNRASNQFLVTYNKQIEDRAYRTQLFPTIDILKDGSTYTSLGFDPFTPDNRLDYGTFNITNNYSFVKDKHNITLGASFESFKSNNLFFYASNGVWVFDSIPLFKQAVNDYLANPNTTTSNVAINRFNYRYTLLPDGKKPWQVFKNQIYSIYAQDEVRFSKKFRMTAGVRFDYINIPNTATDYANPYVAGLTFKTPEGADYKVNTASMPKSRLYVSPRIGFNYNVLGDRTLILRGGTGLFLSRMPYVLISNQLGNNGVNIGLINVTGATARNFPFTLDPSRYTPTNTDVTALRGYNVNYGDPDLKFPQTWKTNLAIDKRIGTRGLVATLEAIYNKNINALNYIDVNMKGPSGKFTAGSDPRDIYPALDLSGAAATAARFYNSGVGNVFVLTNNSEGYSFSLTGKLEKPITKNWGGLLGYTYGVATDLTFVASTVNANTPTSTGVNYLENDFSDNDLRHRFVGALSYRLNYGKNIFGGATTFTLGLVSSSGTKLSYNASNDMNGDGQINDLIYVPATGKNLLFETYTTGGVTFTQQQQEAAFNAYIDNHPYLKERRGQFAERNGGELPWLTRLDLSVEQDFIVRLGKNKTPNTFRFRADILNFGNMLNNDWGVGNVTTTTQPLNYRGRTNGEPRYRLATQVVNGQTVLLKDAFVKSRTIDDVYQVQLGIRYIFNY